MPGFEYSRRQREGRNAFALSSLMLAYLSQKGYVV